MLLQQRDNFPPALLTAFLTTLLSALFTTLLTTFLTTFLTALFTTLLAALLTTSSFCLRVFGRSPSLNCLFGGEEHGDTSVQQRGGGKQERGGYYYNAGLVGGQAGQET